MTTILFGAIVFVLSVGGLAIGLFFGREPLRGTCGRCNCGQDAFESCGRARTTVPGQ